MKQISQREARRLRKRVAQLEWLIEDQQSSYSREWPGGVHIGTPRPESDMGTKQRMVVQNTIITQHQIDACHKYVSECEKFQCGDLAAVAHNAGVYPCDRLADRLIQKLRKAGKIKRVGLWWVVQP